MTCQHTDRLSAYLDGELSGSEREALDVHLASCPECASVLADLRRVVQWAHRFEPSEAVPDGWPAIRDVIERGKVVALPEARQAPVRFHWGLRHVLAAGIAMAALGATATWLVLRRSTQSPMPQSVAVTAPAPTAASVPREDSAPASTVLPSRPAPPAALPTRAVRLSPVAEADYSAAVKDLENTLAVGRDKLDSATVRVLEESIWTIDRAIAEARAAIQRDSTNAYLNAQIAKNMRRKLQLLRVAARAIAAES